MKHHECRIITWLLLQRLTLKNSSKPFIIKEDKTRANAQRKIEFVKKISMPSATAWISGDLLKALAILCGATVRGSAVGQKG